MDKIKSAVSFKGILGITVIICALVLVQGCGNKPSFSTEYQAIFLDNGQVYFGKISELGTKFPLLDDVFYVQSQMNKDTKEISNLLIKRGGEWHAPKNMRINSDHIVFIEPVTSDSKVAQLIAEQNRKEKEAKEKETKK